MPPVDLEAKLRLELREEWANPLRGNLLYPITLPAEEVLVVVADQMIDGPAVTQMDVVDQFEIFKDLQGPIDGG